MQFYVFEFVKSDTKTNFWNQISFIHYLDICFKWERPQIAPNAKSKDKPVVWSITPFSEL